jgi:hypothetical protein
LKINYKLFLLFIFLSLTGFAFQQNEVPGEIPNYRAIVNFLKNAKAYSNDGLHLLEGDARAEFLRKTIQWSQRLEEQNNAHLVKNLTKTSILAKLLYKFGDEFPEDFKRESALRCQNNLAILLNPEDEDLPFNQKISRYKAYGYIWWAQLSIRITGGAAAAAWDQLNRAENHYRTKVAKLWQLHLILKSEYSPFNNPDLDIAHARALYNMLVPPLPNQARRRRPNAALNNLAVALNNAEENIVARDANPAPLEPDAQPLVPLANPIDAPEEALIPMVLPNEPSEPLQPDSMNNREHRQMLRDLGAELRNRELEAAMQGVENLMEFVNFPNQAQLNEDNQDDNSETEEDTDEETCERVEIYSHALAPQELDCTEQKEELSCQKKEETSEEEGDDLEQCITKHLLEMQQAQLGVLSVEVRKSLQEKFNLNSGQLTRSIGKVKKKLNLKTEGLEKFDPTLVEKLRERLVELQTNRFPKGENKKWQETYKISQSSLINLTSLLRKDLNIKINKPKKDLPSSIEIEVNKKVKEMIQRGDKSLPANAKENILKKFNINNKQLSDIVTKERVKQNAMEQIEAKKDAAEEEIYKALKEKRNNNQRNFSKEEKEALAIKLGLSNKKITTLTIKANKRLDIEGGKKKFIFTEEHNNFVYHYLKNRREKNKIKTCESGFHKKFKEAFNNNDIGDKAINKLVASMNIKLDNEGISHEFNDEQKQYVINFLGTDKPMYELVPDFNKEI